MMEIKRLDVSTRDLIRISSSIPTISAVLQEMIMCCIRLPTQIGELLVEINPQLYSIEITLTVKSRQNLNELKDIIATDELLSDIAMISKMKMISENNRIKIIALDVYYCLECRRKFCPEQELFVIQEYLMHMSRLHHTTTWILIHINSLNNPILYLKSTSSIYSGIVEILDCQNVDLKGGKYKIDNLTIEGVFSNPQRVIPHSRTKYTEIFVNRRWIAQNNRLHKLMNALYNSIKESELSRSKSNRLPLAMHAKDGTQESNEVYLFHILCDDQMTKILYDQEEGGRADLIFQNDQLILHCLYLLLYPIFSPVWSSLVSNQRSGHKTVFDEIFREFGYRETNFKRNDQQAEETENFISDALKSSHESSGCDVNQPCMEQSIFETIGGNQSCELLFEESFFVSSQSVSERTHDSLIDENLTPTTPQIIVESLEYPRVCINKLSDWIMETTTSMGVSLDIQEHQEIFLDNEQTPPESILPNSTEERNDNLEFPTGLFQFDSNAKLEENCDVQSLLDADFSSSPNESSHPHRSSRTPMTLSKEILKEGALNLLGQVDNRFILVATKDLILCIDQHAAHERILLEEMEARLGEQIEADSLLVSRITPIQLNLTHQQRQIATRPKYKTHLQCWGFQYNEPNQCDSNIVTLLTVPLIENELATPADFLECINFVSQNVNLPLCSLVPPVVQRVLSFKACRSAIKFGDKLQLQECDDIVRALVKTNLPFQCAHGRPSIVPLYSFR